MPSSGLTSNGYPYNYVSCSCAEDVSTGAPDSGRPSSFDHGAQTECSLNPRDPRANYALFPLEHLMWCEDCHDIRCARCTTEEVVCWYCPSCMFEVASGMVKSEGIRCTRNCHNCPVCTAPMAVNSLDSEIGGMAGPWILACEYCGWTTRDIDVEFDKPNNIFGQLARRYGADRSANNLGPERPQAARATALESNSIKPDLPVEPPRSFESRFRALRNFYTQGMTNAGPTDPLLNGSGLPDYSSPSSLSRIMALYTGTATYGKSSAKPTILRAAQAPEEGARVFSPEEDIQLTRKLRTVGWDGTTSATQRSHQGRANVRFTNELRPVPVSLRTKRSRRCRTCRHILVRPEAKVQSVRYRIKLVAMNYAPALSITPLRPSTSSSNTAPSSTISSIEVTSTSSAPALDYDALPPSRPIQVVLTVSNPMYNAIKVTLATPSEIPGSPSSRVTILCPQFDVPANTDVWADALAGGTTGEIRRSNKGEAVAEAGKIWERGRNWTAVVLEVVGPRLRKDELPKALDEDLLEIPVHFRVEYEAEAAPTAAAGLDEENDTETPRDVKKDRRELAYWCVLGVGRMARVDA